MKKLPLIHTCWLKPFADYFAAKGISLKSYCDQAQIPLAHVTNGDGWITKIQLYEFLQGIADGEQMPEVGYVVGEYLTPDKLGALGVAMADCDTLGDVIRTFCELINRHVEGNRCWLEEGDRGEIWLFNEKVPVNMPGQVIADEAGLFSLISLCRLVAGRDWYPEKACLQTIDTGAHKRVGVLGQIKLAFNAKATGYVFPARWLLKPIQVPTARSAGFDAPLPGLIDENSALSSKVELLLSQILGVGGMCPTAALMAEICGFSERSLFRDLQTEGVAYQEILDKVRFDRACRTLADTELPIKELAYDLGYSGPNNFIRAFKRMSGLTPTAYRESMLKEDGKAHQPSGR